MNAQNIVPIGRAYARSPELLSVSGYQHAQVVKSRNTYRRLYDQNTAALAQARGQLYAAQQQIVALERELTAHRAGKPLEILAETMHLLHEMVTTTRDDERALGAFGVRLPAASMQHTAAGEALISRAAPLLAPTTVKR
jgi:hypothetical protein